jgi:hypothetical protein
MKSNRKLELTKNATIDKPDFYNYQAENYQFSLVFCFHEVPIRFRA